MGPRPQTVTFTFAYVAKDEADFQTNLPKLQLGVAFEDDSIDPLEVTISGTPERCAERLKTLTNAGVSHFVVEFQFHGLETVDFGMAQMETFAKEVVPLL